MKTKNILIINEFYYPFIGGMEFRFKRIAERFSDYGHSVEVMCIAHQKELVSNEVINGVTVKRVVSDETHYKKGVFGRKISTMIKFYFAIRKNIKNKKYDIIIIGQFVIIPLIFSKSLFKNKGLTFIDFVEYRHSFLWKIINNLILNSTDKVSCISNSVQRTILKKHKNRNSENVLSIPNSLDMCDFENKSSEYFLFVGRLVPHKNPDKAILAVLKYNELYPEKSYPIHIVGDGSMFDTLKNQYHENPNVIFHGFVSEKQKQKILSKGRLLVFPSDREGLPGVFIEALGSDLPIITTNGINNNSKDFVTEEKVGEVTGQSINDIVEGLLKVENNREYYLKNIEQAKPSYDLSKIITKFLN
ncbi:glycosyltransferase family 4 protein [Algibacter sp. R77976]|uniref:glycosyltransferase family 4 protein n=1 Tax=Algibacter sp. R77976 TaxID=3093873 RepID=UPI0037C7A691